MRRALVICAVWALTGGVAEAQFFGVDPGFFGIEPGVAAGATISDFVGDDAGETDSRVSAFLGADVIRHPAGSAFGIQSGLQYVRKGASIDTPDEGRATFRTGYIEVPILLRFGPTLAWREIRPVLLAGAAFGIRTGCEVDVVPDGATVTSDCDEAAGLFDVNTFDFGIVGGAAVDIPLLDRVVFSPIVRYTRGVSDAPDAGDVDLKNSVFQLGASLRIRR